MCRCGDSGRARVALACSAMEFTKIEPGRSVGASPLKSTARPDPFVASSYTRCSKRRREDAISISELGSSLCRAISPHRMQNRPEPNGSRAPRAFRCPMPAPKRWRFLCSSRSRSAWRSGTAFPSSSTTRAPICSKDGPRVPGGALAGLFAVPRLWRRARKPLAGRSAAGGGDGVRHGRNDPRGCAANEPCWP